MKLVEGETLTQILKRQGLSNRGNREIEYLLDVFLKVCDAVSFAHSRGVIHRDLKSANVMVGTHGQVWLMDWGFAYLTEKGSAPDHELVSVDRDPKRQPIDPERAAIGTIPFMSPEQAQGRSADTDARTDVFLLGGVLYEILTHRPPYPLKDRAQTVLMAQKGDIVDPQTIAGKVRLPPDLCRIAMRALQPDPANRYQTVDELKADVERSIRNGLWFASVSFPAGSVVFEEGDAADGAYIITGGSCEVFRIENGRRVRLRTLGPGDTFGETSIFSGGTRSAGVEVTEEMTATVVTRESFERAIGGDSWMGSFVRGLSERFLEIDERLSRIRKLLS
jgi:serine/threonine-protein kinase